MRSILPTGDVILAQDRDTGLVQNVAFDANSLDYDQKYQNEQACSGVFQRHLKSVTRILDRHCRGKTLLEVGCGKGYFLEQLLRLGYHVRGIDPAYEGNSPAVVKAHFEPGLGLSGDCVVLRHVLGARPEPVGFLAKTAQANAGRGIVYLEVPCFDWICRHHAWFDVFYEHVNYFRLDDLLRIFAVVHEAGHLFGGQYLYVVADLASVRTPRFSDSVEFPTDFLSGLDHLISLLASGKRRAVWGAAAKGMMVTLYLKRAGIPVDVAMTLTRRNRGSAPQKRPITAMTSRTSDRLMTSLPGTSFS